MKTGIKTESKFVVKPKDKVVICIMKVDMGIITPEWWFTLNPKWWAIKTPIVGSLGAFTVTAKARCSPNDVFNEAIGKKIAKSRAKIKAFKTAKNAWNCIAEVFIKKANKASRIADNCAVMEEFEVKHVKELLE